MGGEGDVCLVVGMMGTQGLEEAAAGEGTTSNRLLSVSSNSKLESLSWEKYYEVNIQEFPPLEEHKGGGGSASNPHQVEYEAKEATGWKEA